MAEEIKNNEQEQELTDIEIAELANKELKNKEAEIVKLKKELAKQKLYSKYDEEDDTPKLTKEQNLELINNPNVCDYDRMEAFCNLSDIEIEEKGVSSFGPQAEEITSFIRGCLEDCEGDKSKFHSIYQARIGNDSPEIAFAYSKRNSK